MYGKKGLVIDSVYGVYADRQHRLRKHPRLCTKTLMSSALIISNRNFDHTIFLVLEQPVCLSDFR